MESIISAEVFYTDLEPNIMAVPKKDPFYNTYNDISELPEHISEEISHFFKVYKTLENKNTEIGER